jgi:hypothetical protein
MATYRASGIARCTGGWVAAISEAHQLAGMNPPRLGRRRSRRHAQGFRDPYSLPQFNNEMVEEGTS